MALDFSLHQQRFTPIKHQQIDQLFSPVIRSPGRIIHDITYQIPELPLSHYGSDDGDNSLLLPPEAEKFPRQSTGLRNGTRPLPTPSDNGSALTSSLLDPEHQMNHDLYPQYRPFSLLKESRPIRATCFHPSGDVYVVGSNYNRCLRICVYPSEEQLDDFTHETQPIFPDIAFTFLQVHQGSIYCAAFNGPGDLLATGSNDQAIRVIRYDQKKRLPTGNEFKLSIHSGTVRDLCFLKSGGGKDTSLLVSGGSGENEIYVTDCATMKPIQVLRGHESSVTSVHCWDDANTFVSGSLDSTIRFWDSRGKLCIKTIDTSRFANRDNKSPVGVVRVEDTGKLLVSGHQDGRCTLFDIKGGRVVQSFKAHEGEIRTLNFSPKSYYLLTGSYDHRVKLMDLQGDLSKKLPAVDVAELNDKVVQTAWHPDDNNFVTTSADGLATLWTMPGMAKVERDGRG